ncbi:DegV family protein [Clostridium sp. OF10-22XD]|jgi:DegV family protein with EDD domain|nr:DegV family protein [Clostridium sp. OF10-22XD]
MNHASKSFTKYAIITFFSKSIFINTGNTNTGNISEIVLEVFIMRNFILSCESTTDLSYSYLNEREIAVIPYTYIIHEHVYEDNMERNPDLMPKYYKMLEKGLLPTTSQINEASYYDFFEGLIQNGDVLHITFSSALSGSANNAYRAAAAIKKNYPGKQLQVIDSLCGAGGYGLLTDYVADMRDEGLSLAAAADWIMKHRTCIHHQFFTTDLTFLHHSGRISGAASHIASILNIHPLIRLDQNGMADAYTKVRGKKRAVREVISEMEYYAENGTDYNGKCFISHAACPELAYLLKNSVLQTFPNVTHPVRILNAGTITASHCGPGAAGLFFLGRERPY